MRNWIPVTSSSDGKELKMGVLRKALLIIAFDLEKICLEGIRERTG